jgi:hypothetical protein
MGYAFVIALIAMWYGMIPEIMNLPEWLSIMKTSSPLPVQSLAARVFGAVFGVVIGLRVITDVFLVVAYSVLEGAVTVSASSPSSIRTVVPVRKWKFLRSCMSAIIVGASSAAVAYVCTANMIAGDTRLMWMLISGIIGISLPMLGIRNLAKIEFYKAVSIYSWNAVLITLGIALFLPVFIILILFSHQYRCTRHLARFVLSSERNPSSNQVAMRSFLGIVLPWGFGVGSYFFLSQKSQLQASLILVASASTLITSNFLYAVFSRFASKGIYRTHGWPINDSTSIYPHEITAIESYFCENIHLAKLGQRSDPVGALRFYIRDLGMVRQFKPKFFNQY